MDEPLSPRRYRVGIDVGLNSVGLAAIQVGKKGAPKKILALGTIVHDGGIDPTANKTAGTRKAISGTSRRARRLVRRRRLRLEDLDRTLKSLGRPLVDLEKIRDPRFPWRARVQLTESKITDENKLKEFLSVAVRHLARHRGWRNPYMSVTSLKAATEPSPYFVTLTQAIADKLRKDPEELRLFTAAEIVSLADDLDIREAETVDKKTGEITILYDVSTTLRGKERMGKDGRKRVGLLESKIHQSDNVRELRKIWDAQELPEDLFNRIVDKVFQARSPKGSAKERVAKDALDSTQRRAEKASLAFQKYRLVQIVANLRIGSHPLSMEQRDIVVKFLWNPVDEKGKKRDDVSWDEIATRLDVHRHDLKGTAAETADGERASARPPVNVTDGRIRECGIKEVVAEWDDIDESYKEALIEVLSNGSGSGAHPSLVDKAMEFVAGLPEEVLGKIDNIKLPEGRAAYSAKTMRKLTKHMLATTDDLHAARKAVFGVDDFWKPPAEPIGTPVGNPAVDRVLTIVSRFLLACEREWGTPLSVAIEHTREGLMSEKQARKRNAENKQRLKDNRTMDANIAKYVAEHSAAIRAAMDDSFEENSDTPITGRAIGSSKQDIDRWRAFTRQHGQCLYCGTSLIFPVFEMDHILPRAGKGATNTQVNLAAVCRACNLSKGKQLFAVWATSGMRRQVSLRDALDRVRGFEFFGAYEKDYRYQARFKRDLKVRLTATEQDDPIDNRSIESVGWMANELHHRIKAHYAEINPVDKETTVGVFRGWITSEARKAAGIEGRMVLIGGRPGKNRLDRRHHAVDAATIAMIRQGAAQSLVVQDQAAKDAERKAIKEKATVEGNEVWDLAHVLAVRDNLRRTNQIDPRAETDWKQYRGANVDLFDAWVSHMEMMAALVQEKLDKDEVPVFEFLRLRLGSSQVTEDTVQPFACLNETEWSQILQADNPKSALKRKLELVGHELRKFNYTKAKPSDPDFKDTEPGVRLRLKDALPEWLIDSSATPQQWVALTRHPDFEKGKGLPPDPNREIRIKEKWVEADDEIEFFPPSSYPDMPPGCLKVRGGYVELGSSFHHGRIYRCSTPRKNGTAKTFYAMLRVYQVDLSPYRGKQASGEKLDLFMVDLPAHSMSRRACEAKLRRALHEGTAEYIGWVVSGDEIVVDMSSQTSGKSGAMVSMFSDQAGGNAARRWVIQGLGQPTKLTLKPRQMAEEGLSEDAPPEVKAVFASTGWVVSIDVLFGKCHPTIIRRDILGRPRTTSAAHLPISWSVGEATDSVSPPPLRSK